MFRALWRTSKTLSYPILPLLKLWTSPSSLIGLESSTAHLVIFITLQCLMSDFFYRWHSPCRQGHCHQYPAPCWPHSMHSLIGREKNAWLWETFLSVNKYTPPTTTHENHIFTILSYFNFWWRANTYVQLQINKNKCNFTKYWRRTL